MGINQRIVLDIILEHGPISFDDIKRFVLMQPHKIDDVKKVVDSLLAKGKILATSGLYSISTRPLNTSNRKSNRFEKAILAGYTIGKPLSYPSDRNDGVIDNSAIIDYLVTNKRLTKSTESSIGLLVDLTEHNSRIVEAQIPIGMIGKRMYKLAKKYLPNAYNLYVSLCTAGNLRTFDFTNRNNVLSIVEKIDSDNGTLDHKNHHDFAINAFTDFIINRNNNFLSRLNGSTFEIKQLVRDLKTSCTAYNANSLASKVCKYFHEYYYGDDKFFINDSVVRSVLPYYLDAFGIEHHLSNAKQVDKLSYSDLYDLLDALYARIPLFESGRRMTKTEFDHILWYCYRNYQIK